MYFKSKAFSLILLGLTSLVCSGIVFALFNDPEGPNLLVVIGMAAILYFFSISMYFFEINSLSLPSGKRLYLAIGIQIVVGSVFYSLM